MVSYSIKTAFAFTPNITYSKNSHVVVVDYGTKMASALYRDITYFKTSTRHVVLISYGMKTASPASLAIAVSV